MVGEKEVKVLIVEDDPGILALIEFQLHNAGGFIPLLAPSLEAARLFLKTVPDIRVVAIDGCDPENTFNTLPLVKKLCNDFDGKIIAMAASRSDREIMVSEGCDFACKNQELTDILIGMKNSGMFS